MLFTNLLQLFWLRVFARSKPALSRACCEGPGPSPDHANPVVRQNAEAKVLRTRHASHARHELVLKGIRPHSTLVFEFTLQFCSQ